MKKFKVSDNRLLTRAEVAEIFQVSPSTITRWADTGKLPAVKTLGGHRRYEAKVVLGLVRHLIREEVSMEKTVVTVPTMYGDHHVLEVRRILLQMAGVDDVNASSCFQAVEVSYDPTKISGDDIKTKLHEAGYLGDLPVPVEADVAASEKAQPAKEIFFRHTAAYEQTDQTISFAQNVSSTKRPLQ